MKYAVNALSTDAGSCLFCTALLLLDCTKLTEHHNVLGFCARYTCISIALLLTPNPRSLCLFSQKIFQNIPQKKTMCKFVCDVSVSLVQEAPMQSCCLILQGKRLTPAGLKVQGTPFQQLQKLQSVSPCFTLHPGFAKKFAALTWTTTFAF